MLVQLGMCQTWSEPKLFVFSRIGSYHCRGSGFGMEKEDLKRYLYHTRFLYYSRGSGFGMEKEDLKRQVEMLRIHKDLQRMFVSDAVKE